jgi:molybdopterin-guanine dinucleotide biosynthesis protein B
MNKIDEPVIVSFVGHSNSGKTGLITQLIPIIKKRNISVGVIKHACSPITIDQQGKDSFRHFKAGADPVMICTDQHMAFFSKRQPELGLKQIAQLFYKDKDLILTEGFKKEPFPKIEIFRSETEEPPLCLKDQSIIAIVTNHHQTWHLPQFYQNDLDQLVDFIIKKVVIH